MKLFFRPRTGFKCSVGTLVSNDKRKNSEATNFAHSDQGET